MYKDVEYCYETHTVQGDPTEQVLILYLLFKQTYCSQLNTQHIALSYSTHSYVHLSLSINFDSSENSAKNTEVRMKLHGVNQCGQGLHYLFCCMFSYH